MSSSTPPSRSKKKGLYIAGGVVAGLIVVLVLIVGFLFHSDSGNRQKKVQMVTLVAPPPPPKVEEKPPEPEKEEEKIETPPEEKPLDQPEPANEPPPANLGLDADAGLGGDAFGLEARRGGSSLIGGSGAGSVFGWYANQVSGELQKIANEIIQKEGGIPPGNYKKVTFEVMVDVFGKIQKYSILNSSGNERIDEAVKRALQMARTFEPPPPGMPKVMRISVTLEG